MISRTVMRGLSEEYGSWKTTCIFRRIISICFSSLWVISSPSKNNFPPLDGYSRRMQRANVVFPQPLSPTRPSVSYRLILKDTESTAISFCPSLPRSESIKGFGNGNTLFSFCTSSTVSVML
jgi:hypothetical protein